MSTNTSRLNIHVGFYILIRIFGIIQSQLLSIRNKRFVIMQSIYRSYLSLSKYDASQVDI